MTLDLRTAVPTREPFPLYPPRHWFSEMPDWFREGDKLSFQIDGPDAGRVAATVAPRDQCILDGSNECWTAPMSPTNYEAAHQGDTMTADGAIIRTANLCAGVNHARVSMSFRDVADRSANTGTQIARVQYHDLPGYIVALGALWPDVTEQQIAIARASALSGDWRWRPELGDYDMAEAILVNNPGFPLMSRAASLVNMATGEDLGPAVVIGGMGGLGGLDDGEPCPSCGTPGDLGVRVADLEAIVAGLGDSPRLADVAAMLPAVLAGLDALKTLPARVGALEDIAPRTGDIESAVGELVQAVGRAPRRLVVKRDADRLVTEIVEEP